MDDNVYGQPPTLPQGGASRFVEEKQHWYGKTWVIVLFLLLFWPVGIALMWAKSCKWDLATKLAVTIFLVVFLVWRISTWQAG